MTGHHPLAQRYGKMHMRKHLDSRLSVELDIPSKSIQGNCLAKKISIIILDKSVDLATLVSIFKIRGQGKIGTFGLPGDRPHETIHLKGIATDDADNIYVSSDHKLQKFTSKGELIKCTGEKGKKEGEFDDPRGLTLYNNEVYVCNCDNHCIQIFDLDLNFVRSICSHGEERGEFNAAFDVKFDTAGNMYVAEWDNERVQVMDRSGKFIQKFGEGKLKRSSSLHIADKYVYVSDWSGCCTVVYETSGQFVTSFGTCGKIEREFDFPFCITSCVDGYIHVYDLMNNRV